MTTRTSKKTVTFRKPFVLDGFDEVLPAGAYRSATGRLKMLRLVGMPIKRS
jgi:hypothetical protein